LTLVVYFKFQIVFVGKESDGARFQSEELAPLHVFSSVFGSVFLVAPVLEGLLARFPFSARTIRQAAWVTFRLIVTFGGGRIIEGNANGESRLTSRKERQMGNAGPDVFVEGVNEGKP
jgi:hypothetical protein